MIPRIAGHPRLVGLLAAVVTTAAMGLVLPLVGPAAPAAAAVCDTTSGGTVIVDFNQLGGGVQGACVASGGGDYASTLFPNAGFDLRYATRQGGFVCRVSEVPASDPCLNTAPASSYWGLWWSDGDPGSAWTYASAGVGSLKIPDGGLVAFSWDEVSGDERPSAAATRPAAPAAPAASPSTSSPTPSPPSSSHPTPRPPSSPGADPSTVEPAPTPTDNPSSASPTDTSPGTGTPTGIPTGTPTGTPPKSTDAPTDTPSTGSSDDPGIGSYSGPAGPADPPSVGDPVAPAAAGTADDGLPGWVAPIFIVLLFAAAGGSLLLRRRQSNSS